MSKSIHPKNKSPGCPDYANYFEFLQTKLAENMKTNKFALLAGLTQVFPPNCVQSLLSSWITTFKHGIFST